MVGFVLPFEVVVVAAYTVVKSALENYVDTSSSGLIGDNDELDLIDVAKRPEGNFK